MASPLFPRFNRLLREQQEALRQWQQMNSASRSTRRTSRTAQPGRPPRSGQPTRYGIGSGANWLWNAVLRKLGPLGQVIDAMLRPHGQQMAPTVQHELDAAQRLLETFGFTVNAPGMGAGTGLAGGQASPIARELIDEDLPGIGRPSRPGNGIISPTMPRRSTGRPRHAPPESQPGTPGAPGTPNAPGSPAQPIAVPSQGGSPLTQGMIPVRSSNVHSIGYEWPTDDRRPGNLLVRFLGGTGKNRSGPGPLYRYKDVPREVFLAFQRAASKGKFVWDELRVRGTVSGHQYDYDLAGLGEGDYVPRQAGLQRGQKGEFYMQRSFRGRRSTLPTQQVRGPRGELTPDFRKKAASVKLRAGRRP